MKKYLLSALLLVVTLAGHAQAYGNSGNSHYSRGGRGGGINLNIFFGSTCYGRPAGFVICGRIVGPYLYSPWSRAMIPLNRIYRGEVIADPYTGQPFRAP